MNIPRMLAGTIAVLSLHAVPAVAGLKDGMSDGPVTLKSAGPLAFAPEGSCWSVILKLPPSLRFQQMM
jgi:hypothetical protein